MKIYHHGLKDLKACLDLSDLALLLGVKPKFLSKQVYHVTDDVKYKVFYIPKKGGSDRIIHAPNPRLKFLQSRLSRLLYQCHFDLHGRADYPSRALSHGFQRARGLSIYTNASRHTNRRHVFNVDLKDFFPTINFGRVRGYFISNKNFELSRTVATVIAQTCCFNNALPQGAPTSPVVAELIGQALDYRLQSIARRYRCTYSRYADDITFSTNLSVFPTGIGCPLDTPGEWGVGSDLNHAFHRAGFLPNLSKVRMQHSSQRQATTSLTVNEKVNIGSYYYKGVRFASHAMMTSGKAEASKRAMEPGKPLTSSQILGMLMHIHDIKGRASNHATLRSYKDENNAPHYLRILGKFFHYHRIHMNERPIIICEGKTDYIYIKEAIRWSAADKRISNLLVDPVKLTAPKLKGDQWRVDFLRHSKAANSLLHLGGGGGSLVHFVRTHFERVVKYHENPLVRPVIVVVDNDSQSNAMWSLIKKLNRSEVEITGSERFYRVGENLYVVPIPSGGKSDFYIEKLLPVEWQSEKLGARVLKLHQKKGEILKPGEYGKTEFAERVIRANRGKVNYSKFIELLHIFCDIIEKK
jgi:RNA-directed DNA polymerase